MEVMERRKLIIDTDCGSDDAVAIAMALNDERYEILLFSVVAGNVPAKQAAANLLTTMQMTNNYYPDVYLGKEEMLKRDWVGADDTHGKDGMGDLGLIDLSLKAKEGDAVEEILKAIEKEEDRTVEIITLGPLTNIAAAIERSPKTMKKVRRIVCMATPGTAEGNVTEYAEFNVWQDAEAFDLVLKEHPCEILLVGWSSCLGEAMLEEEDIRKIKESGRLGKFLIDANRCLIDMNLDRFHRECLDMADPAAIAAALYPECIRDCERVFCSVETGNDEHYGEVYFDSSCDKPNVSLCTELDGKKFRDYLYKTLKIS